LSSCRTTSLRTAAQAQISSHLLVLVEISGRATELGALGLA
jgi:hypothetical protein